jgi:hypothetical protein
VKKWLNLLSTQPGQFHTGKKLVPCTLPHVTNFALWDENNPKDLAIIEDSIGELKVNYVFVGLNFAGKGNVAPEWQNWNNFHCSTGPHRGDNRLQTLLNKSKFRGAYMTDIIKNYATPNAATLAARIQDIDEPTHIKWFVEEINLLETDNIQVFLLGKDVEDKFIKYSNLLEPIRSKVSLCQRIEHFGPANARFPKWVPVQLGLRDNDVGTTIYPPLDIHGTWRSVVKRPGKVITVPLKTEKKDQKKIDPSIINEAKKGDPERAKYIAELQKIKEFLESKGFEITNPRRGFPHEYFIYCFLRRTSRPPIKNLGFTIQIFDNKVGYFFSYGSDQEDDGEIGGLAEKFPQIKKIFPFSEYSAPRRNHTTSHIKIPIFDAKDDLLNKIEKTIGIITNASLHP